MAPAAHTNDRNHRTIKSFQDTALYRDVTGIVRSSTAREKSNHHAQQSKKQRIEALVKSLVEKQQIPTRMALTTSSACIKTASIAQPREQTTKRQQLVWQEVDDVWTVMRRAAKEKTDHAEPSPSALSLHQDQFEEIQQIGETTFISPCEQRVHRAVSYVTSSERMSQRSRKVNSTPSTQSKITSSYRKSKMMHVSGGGSPLTKTCDGPVHSHDIDDNRSRDPDTHAVKTTAKVSIDPENDLRSTTSPFIYHKRRRTAVTEAQSRSTVKDLAYDDVDGADEAAMSAHGEDMLNENSPHSKPKDLTAKEMDVDEVNEPITAVSIPSAESPVKDRPQTDISSVTLQAASKSPPLYEATPEKTTWPGTQAMINEAQQSLFRSPLLPRTDHPINPAPRSASASKEKALSGAPTHQLSRKGKLRRSSRNLPNTQSLIAGWTAWSPVNASTKSTPATNTYKSADPTPVTVVLSDLDKDHLRINGMREKKENNSRLRQSDCFLSPDASPQMNELAMVDADTTLMTGIEKDDCTLVTPVEDASISASTSHHQHEAQDHSPQYLRFTEDESLLNGTITEIAQALLSSPA